MPLPGFFDLQFMAPELARGQSRTPATDVFVLGAILYRASTGRPLHRGEGMDAFRMAREGTFEPPAECVAGYPASIESALLKALAVRPEDRYDDPAAFAAALEIVLDEAAIEPETALLAELARSAIDARTSRRQ